MGVLIVWNVLLTMLVVILTKAVAKLIDQVEAIKSWYPFCELLEIKKKDIGE